MSKPIEVPFGMWTWVGPVNHVLDGAPDPPCKEAILKGKGEAHCQVSGLSAVICAKMADPIYTVNHKKTWQFIFDYNFG